MQRKLFTLILIMAVLMLALAGCGRTQLPEASGKPESADRQTEQSAPNAETSVSENAPADKEDPPEEESPEEESPEEESPEEESPEEESPEEEPWKTALAEDLFEQYGVLPEYYEDLGDGIYQVYVEVGGEIVPFVTVDSATGDYHG